MKKLLMRELLHAVPMVTTIGIGASLSVAEDRYCRSAIRHRPLQHLNETAQRRFDRATRYRHSFWYKASKTFSRKRSRPIRHAPSPTGALHSGS